MHVGEPLLLKVPAAQAEHDAEPDIELNCPAAQSVQPDEPASLKVPMGHDAQNADPCAL